MALFHSFFWLSDNPLYHISIHSSSMDSSAPIRKHRHLSVTSLSLHAFFLSGKVIPANVVVQRYVEEESGTRKGETHKELGEESLF